MDVEAFIERWRRCDSGSERGNAAMYLREMMDASGDPNTTQATCSEMF